MIPPISHIGLDLTSTIFTFLDVPSCIALTTTAKFFATCTLDLPLSTAQELIETHPQFYQQLSKRVKLLVPQALIYRPENLAYAPLADSERPLYIHLLALLKLTLNDFDGFLSQLPHWQTDPTWATCITSIISTDLPKSPITAPEALPRVLGDALYPHIQAKALVQAMQKGALFPYTLIEASCKNFPVAYNYFRKDISVHFENKELALNKITEKGCLIDFANKQNQDLAAAAVKQNPVWNLLLPNQQQTNLQFDDETLSQACGQFPRLSHYIYWSVTANVQVVTEAVKHDPFIYKQLTISLRKQPSLLWALANTLLKYPRSTMVDDLIGQVSVPPHNQELIKQLAQSSAVALRFSETLQKDQPYLLSLAPLYDKLIIDLPEALRQDKVFLLRLLKANPQSWPWIASTNLNFHLDPCFLTFAKEHNMTKFQEELELRLRKYPTK